MRTSWFNVPSVVILLRALELLIKLIAGATVGVTLNRVAIVLSGRPLADLLKKKKNYSQFRE